MGVASRPKIALFSRAPEPRARCGSWRLDCAAAMATPPAVRCGSIGLREGSSTRFLQSRERPSNRGSAQYILRSSMCCSPHPPSSEREHTSPEGYVLHSHLWEQSRGFKGWAVDGTRKPWPTLKALPNSQRRRARIGRVMPCVWFHQPSRQRRRSPKKSTRHGFLTLRAGRSRSDPAAAAAKGPAQRGVSPTTAMRNTMPRCVNSFNHPMHHNRVWPTMATRPS